MTTPDARTQAIDVDGAILRRIRERCEKATKGPWDAVRYECENGEIGYDVESPHETLTSKITCSIERRLDADFIAHAREDIPWLLDQLATLRATCETLGKKNAGLHSVLADVNAVCDLEGHDSIQAALDASLQDCGNIYCDEINRISKDAEARCETLEQERDGYKNHIGQCVKCQTWTCGFCGISDEHGKWHCERCQWPERQFGALVTRAEAAEATCATLTQERDELQRELLTFQRQFKPGCSVRNRDGYWCELDRGHAGLHEAFRDSCDNKYFTEWTTEEIARPTLLRGSSE